MAITLIDSGNNNGDAGYWNEIVFPEPSTFASGDLWILMGVLGRFEGRTISSYPTGFTEQYNVFDGDSGRIWLAYKVMDGTESGTVTVTFSGNERYAGNWIVLRGVDQSTPFDIANGATTDGFSTSPSFSTITPTTDGAMILSHIVAASHNDPTITWDSDQTLISATPDEGELAYSACAYEIVDPAASNSDYSGISLSISTGWMTILSALRPATTAVQGAATATQAQAATTVATTTVQGAATASQAQVATTVATLTEQGVAAASQTQVATTAATTTTAVQGAATASQGQVATTVATTTVQGVATASQGQIATAAATTAAVAQGAATASQDQISTTAATLTVQGVTTASQAQVATTAATTIVPLTFQGVASASQDQVGVTIATGGEEVFYNVTFTAVGVDDSLLSITGADDSLLSIVGGDGSLLSITGEDNSLLNVVGSDNSLHQLGIVSMAQEKKVSIPLGSDFTIEVQIAGSGSISGQTFRGHITTKDDTATDVVAGTPTVYDAANRIIRWAITDTQLQPGTGGLPTSSSRDYRWAIWRDDAGSDLPLVYGVCEFVAMPGSSG